MPELPGHERREERKRRRRHRRLVRSGDSFTSEELAEGLVELEVVDPSPEPDDEEYEPWGMDDSKERSERDRERLRAYREFIAVRERNDPDYTREVGSVDNS